MTFKHWHVNNYGLFVQVLVIFDQYLLCFGHVLELFDQMVVPNTLNCFSVDNGGLFDNIISLLWNHWVLAFGWQNVDFDWPKIVFI